MLVPVHVRLKLVEIPTHVKQASRATGDRVCLMERTLFNFIPAPRIFFAVTWIISEFFRGDLYCLRPFFS